MRQHIRLLAPLFGLIAAVWLLRLVLSFAGAPDWLVRSTSVTAANAISILIAVYLIHRRRFGSYPSVVVAAFVLTVWSQVLIIGAILVSVLTNVDNIYTAPEYSFPQGNDPYRLRHMWGQITFGIGFGTLQGAALGCLLFWILRILVPARTHPDGRA
jgi:hypothetical protein